MSLPELPSEDIEDGEIRIWTTRHMNAHADKARADALEEAAKLKALLRDAREWVEVGCAYEHDESEARDLLRQIDAAIKEQK